VSTFTRERVRFDSPAWSSTRSAPSTTSSPSFRTATSKRPRKSRLTSKMKALTARLHQGTTGTVDDRKWATQRQLEQSDEWATLQLAEAELAGCKVAYDYLDSRRSLLQSVLKQFQHDAQADRFGSGRPQRGDASASNWTGPSGVDEPP
jgi:hypothetical protein